MKKSLLIAAAITLTYMTPVLAAVEDEEISIMAAEQRKFNEADATITRSDDDEVEVFSSNESLNLDNNVSNTTIETTVETMNSEVNEKKNNVITGNENIIGLPNSIVTYNNFNDAAKKVGFIPLYVPRKSGYAINYIAVISDKFAEIRYARRWEPSVTLSIRTYKRAAGEEIKDISGVHGANWKVDLSAGTTIYMAKINDTTNAASWAIGQYTFAAMTENLSFAAFHSLVVEELVDLCTHYYIDIV